MLCYTILDILLGTYLGLQLHKLSIYVLIPRAKQNFVNWVYGFIPKTP